MEITKKIIGKFEGKDVLQYNLKNSNGVDLLVMNYGATIMSLKVPDAKLGKVNIVCGFDELSSYFSKEYISNSPFFGSTIGRYCSAIIGGEFELEGVKYELSKNAGTDNLHGGVTGFDKMVWDSEIIPDCNGVKFTLLSPDGDNGFPGEVKASVLLCLTENNEIVYDYHAVSDKLTPFSMTNHNYFNLSGFKNNVEEYTVMVDAEKRIPLGSQGVYTDKVIDVRNTMDDLRSGRKIKDVHEALKGGFEHFYLFGAPIEEPKLVASISDEVSKRKLDVFTTEPGMLFYTGKYTSDKLQRETGEKFGQYRAFCCETHRCPNGPNLKGAPYVYLEANQPFSSKTILKLTL